MGSKQSSPRPRNSEGFYHYTSATSTLIPHNPESLAVNDSSRPRARSLFSSLNDNFDTLSFSSSPNTLSITPTYMDSESSSTDNSILSGRLLALNSISHSLPPSLFSFEGLKCPVCSKKLPADDIEYHLVMCLTKPRLSYNEDTLKEDGKGECAICLDDMSAGQRIARLPCLCIYHKGCIDSWFRKSRSCPEHPLD